MFKSYGGLLFFIIGLVALTKSYVFFAQLISVSVGSITSFFFILNIIFLIPNRKHLIKIQSFGFFSQFLLWIPIIISIINQDFAISKVLLQFFYFSLILVGAVGILKFRKELEVLVFIAVIINFIAGLVSMFYPFLFANMSEIVSAEKIYGGRAIGFYLQPNALGLASVLNLIFCLAISGTKSKKILISIICITVLITGSRTAIILFFIILLCQFYFLFKRRRIQIKKVLKTLLQLGAFGIILYFLLLQSVFASIFNNEAFSDLESRIEFFSKFNLEKLDDSSLATRSDYQKEYIDNLPNYIVTGNGFGVQKARIEAGKLEGSAHNMFLEILYQGGIIYLISFFVLLWYLWYLGRKNSFSYHIKSDLISLLLLFIIISSFMSTTLFDMRALYLGLGVVIQIDILRDSNSYKLG